MCIRDRYQRRVHGDTDLPRRKKREMRTITFIIVTVLFCCGLTRFPAYDRCNPDWVLKLQDGNYFDCSQPGSFNPKISWASEMTAIANILYKFKISLDLAGLVRPATPLNVQYLANGSYFYSGPGDYLPYVGADYLPLITPDQVIYHRSKQAEVIAHVESTGERVIITDIQADKTTVEVLNSKGETKYYKFSELENVFYALVKTNGGFLAQMVRIVSLRSLFVVVIHAWINARFLMKNLINTSKGCSSVHNQEPRHAVKKSRMIKIHIRPREIACRLQQSVCFTESRREGRTETSIDVLRTTWTTRSYHRKWVLPSRMLWRQLYKHDN
eukprot:TRINITY_DN1523_c0_g1_i6.p1 TRINITY_DN1523_c0_g1~~TRINITY_DN1523_c0_g1_i6.p1  ORF type:complete len:328 (+),score=20.00 TRINITY_DN1523_c0_g1_i6:86-1069(+)